MSTDLIPQNLTPQQQGWLKLAATKQSLFEKLQNGELEIQQLVSNITDDKDLTEVQTRIKKAKEVFGENKEARLHFTNMLQERLIGPSMEFEKRNEALLSIAGKHELELRNAAWQKQQAAAAKDKEVAEFKAHIINEYERKGSVYRQTLSKMIADAYKDCLGAKRPVKELVKFLEPVRTFMSEIKLVPFIPFTGMILTDAEKLEIFKSVPAYDPADDLKDAFVELDKRFEMYKEDLKNAEAAVKKAEEELAAKQKQEEEQLEQTTAINNLTAQATGTIETKGVKIKKSWAVEIENSEEWALNVMRAFLSNFTTAKTYLGVKTWGKLSIGQMAVAVGKMYTDNNKIPITGLKFVEVKK